jgi:hypothetical protein
VIHVDDIVATGSHNCLQHLISVLKKNFELSGHNGVKTYTGLTVSQKNNVTVLNSSIYIRNTLKKFKATVKVARIPALDSIEPRDPENEPQASTKFMQELCGSLLWLSRLYRPDITFAVNDLCRSMHDPSDRSVAAGLHILAYLNGTIDYGLRIVPSSNLLLQVYCDASMHRIGVDTAIGSVAVFINSTPLYWSSSKFKRVMLNIYLAELASALDAAREAVYFRKFLAEIGISSYAPTTIYCDNDAVVKFAHRVGLTDEDRHLDHKFFAIREMQSDLVVNFVHIPTAENAADILTKPLQYPAFSRLREMFHLSHA